MDEFFGVLLQGQGPRLTDGDFDVFGPCSGRWSATTQGFATYHPGKTTFAMQVEVIAGPDNGVLFPHVTGSIVLRPVLPDG